MSFPVELPYWFPMSSSQWYSLSTGLLEGMLAQDRGEWMLVQTRERRGCVFEFIPGAGMKP